MIYLIHGKNEVDSRRFLTKMKSSYEDIKVLDGKNLDKIYLDSLVQVSSRELFGGKSALLIEGFTGQMGTLPKKIPEDLDLLLWTNKRLAKVPGDIKTFLFDKTTQADSFKFVDALLLKQEKKAHIFLNGLLEAKEPPEKIIGTINRSLCLVYFALEGTIKQTLLPQFIQQKYLNQAKYWSKSSIKKSAVKLLQADLSVKSGRKPKTVLANLVAEISS